jgi:excisionase family DNA binding protein
MEGQDMKKEGKEDWLKIIQSEKLLTVNVVAGRLKTSPSTVYRLIYEGKLKAIKLSPRSIRVLESSIDGYLERLNRGFF